MPCVSFKSAPLPGYTIGCTYPTPDILTAAGTFASNILTAASVNVIVSLTTEPSPTSFLTYPYSVLEPIELNVYVVGIVVNQVAVDSNSVVSANL